MFTKVARSPGVPLAKPLTRSGLRGRRALKRFLYAQMALRQAVMIALGREAPLVPFTVEADPPSVYYVFRIRPDVLDALADRLSLPAHLPLAPIRCLIDDDPAHLIVLNVYRVSGLANGLRAEWSVFVADETGVPRYLVFDARSSKVSMDPVDVITKASPVKHRREGTVISTRVGEGEGSFTSTIEMPDDETTGRVSPAPEWAIANDFIYWGNGICDRTFYAAGMVDPRQRKIAGSAFTLEDHTPWAELVEPEPVHVLVLEDAIELVISPWENLKRLDA